MKLKHFVYGTLFMGGLVAVALYFLAIPYSKYQVCKTYYPELGIVACMMSKYGLPQRGAK